MSFKSVSNSNSIPAKFVEMLSQRFPKEYKDMLIALEQSPKTAVRIHPAKSRFAQHLQGVAVPWNKWGLTLNHRPNFTLDPFFHGGAYYVQESSSMALELVLESLNLNPSNQLIGDFCAAPGGKTTILASFFDKSSLIVANEVVPKRASVLKENVCKWGTANVIVTSNQLKDFSSLKNHFDLLLIDAPCSGEGMFRKDPFAREQWNENLVNDCALQQKQILKHVSDLLKPGGYLVYSTCTFNATENESQIEALIDTREYDWVNLPAFNSLNIPNALGLGYAFLPHQQTGEGLFLSVLKKRENSFTQTKIKTKKVETCKIGQWYKAKEDFQYFKIQNGIFAIHKNNLGVLEKLLQLQLKILHFPLEICEIKGKKEVPLQSIANSILLDHSDYPSIEVDEQGALNFLRGNALSAYFSIKGFALLTHNGMPLGWVNALGNRCNNLYPASWRIKYL